MTWYNKLKFKENPLDARPNPNLVGLEEEEERLINFIQKEEICFLNGPTGSAKTSLLLKIQKGLKGHKFIYLDAQDLPPDFNLERELKRKRNFFDWIRLKGPSSKKPVLFIDEFQATDPNLVLEARSKWDKLTERRIKSIVIAQINRQLRNVSGSFRERLGKRIIKLPHSLDDDLMKEILKIRLHNKKTNINYNDRIEDKAVDLLVRYSDGNVRRLLEYADLLFDYHHIRFKDKNPLIKGKKYNISYFAAKNILAENKIIIGPKDKFKVKTASLNKIFTPPQQRVIKLLFKLDVATPKDISGKLKMPLPKVQKTINSLKRINAIMMAGSEGKQRLWEITPRVKRLMVKK